MRFFSLPRLGSLFVLSGVVSGLVAASSCVRHARQTTAYPSRGPGCSLTIFNGPVPRGVYYDDIGPVDAGCYLETTRTECMRQLRAEACKMGGDIVYDVPEKPLRPEWREYHYKGIVAHTRALKQSDIDEGRAPADAKIGSSSTVAASDGKAASHPDGAEPGQATAAGSSEATSGEAPLADGGAVGESASAGPVIPLVPFGPSTTTDAGAR